MQLVSILRSLAVVALLGGTATAVSVHRADAAQAEAETHVVYHISEVASMRDALNNISNQLNFGPPAQITLLANSRGVFALAKGEGDRRGKYAETVAELQARGVKFVACGYSMGKNNLVGDSMIEGVTTVESGVVELARLQTQEHYGYIKP